MVDMVQLLSTLSAGPKALIPSFYENVRHSTKTELESYDFLSKITKKPVSNLRSRWREPSLSIHSLGGSGPPNSTVISHSVPASARPESRIWRHVVMIPGWRLSEKGDTSFSASQFPANENKRSIRTRICN
ncbi:hypothetical protein CALVIDRAFT_415758 [Calocera viscosa TUFC12733]|uniref:Uncharacterized protein n=1 Tax=Calocera viscosa (strain TUFC12733) TaxID=1330018 RepID=A0A167G0F0_CALVF|nr:hypothetical protein CALVIDRAFT_415758 [Calocera viscosa TUFC12733]